MHITGRSITFTSWDDSPVLPVPGNSMWPFKTRSCEEHMLDMFNTCPRRNVDKSNKALSTQPYPTCVRGDHSKGGCNSQSSTVDQTESSGLANHSYFLPSHADACSSFRNTFPYFTQVFSLALCTNRVLNWTVKQALCIWWRVVLHV